MLRKKIQKILTTFTAIAVTIVYSNIVVFAQGQTMGEITVTGNVSVNGQPAVSGSTVITNSRITTGASSTATVSFGGNGKLEFFENTDATIKFTNDSIVVLLEDGKIGVMNAAGIGATVVTRTATVVADAGRANSFLVWLGCSDDKDCKETFAQTISGLITMTTGSDQELKQIPAGTQMASGDTCNTECVRPGTVLPVAVAPGIGPALLALLLGGIGAAVVTTILVNQDPPPDPDGEVPVISPNQ